MKVDINKEGLLRYIKWVYWIYWIPILGQWWYKKYIEKLNYSFEEDHFSVEGGVFFYRKKLVPYSGLREVSMNRGPICQMLNLSVVTAHTAAVNIGTPEIMILCPENPQLIIDELVKRSQVG